MLEEKLSFSPNDLDEMDLGKLNNLRYRAFGRVPTDVEWAKVYKVSSAVASHLGVPDLKRKIRIRELKMFFGTIPLIFFSTSVVLTFAWVIQPWAIDELGQSDPLNMLIVAGTIIWALSQGGLGACAFLCTSVITKSAEDTIKTKNSPEGDSMETDSFWDSSDITDRNLLKSRIVLGALFGFLLGLPIARSSLDIIYRGVVPHTGIGISATDASLMLMPFLIGFSTNLVLALFSKFIAVIQALFSAQTRR
jgi:hypothetical protein